ncbi:MAG: aminoglycoside phosphotransferase family protein [Thermodesulfobacteriota bacterium]
MPETDNLSDKSYKEAMGRSDFRFLLSDFRPQISICSAGGLLLDATGLISETAVEFAADSRATRCDLFVAVNPGREILEAAFSALGPGGNLYAEWTVDRRFESRVITERLSRIGFDSICLYLPRPDPSNSIPTAWIPLGVTGAIEFLVNAGHSRNTTARFAKRIGRTIRRFFWRLIPGLFLKYPWLLSSGSNRFTVCSICCKPDENVSAMGATETPLKILRDYARLGLDGRAEGLSAMMLARGADSVDKNVLYIYRGRDNNPSAIVKISKSEDSADMLRNESEVLRAINDKFRKIRGVPKILCRSLGGEINISIQTVVSGVELSSLLNESNYRQYAEMITGWLVNFAENTRTELPEDWRAKMVFSVLSELDSLLGGAVSPDFMSKTVKSLEGVEIPCLVCEHRDFGPQNIYVNGENPGVIDWEFSRLSGLPALDLIFFLTRASMQIQGAPRSIAIRECYRQMLDGDTFTGTVFRNCMDTYMNGLGISRTQIHSLRLLTWIVHYYWRMFYDKKYPDGPVDRETSLSHWTLELWMEELSRCGN